MRGRGFNLSRRGLKLSIAALGVLTLGVALLFRILIGEILGEGGALLRKLLPIGLQAVRTGQLQKLLPQLGRVSLYGNANEELDEMIQGV